MDVDRNSDLTNQEMVRLVSAMLDQQIVPADEQRLLALLESDASARAQYVDCVATHVLLEAMHEPALCMDPDRCGVLLPIALPMRGASPDLGNLHHVNDRPARSRRSLSWLAGWALAGCLLIAGGIWLSAITTANRQPTTNFVGVLSKASGASWIGCWKPESIPARLAAGQRLQFDSGTAEMTLNSGCTIVVKGPADLTLVSPMRVTARCGTVRARVGESAQGFVLETPTTKVVDLGTEFGVQVDALSHNTDVVVFEGMVDLEVDPTGRHQVADSRDPSHTLTRLASGEALRVDRAGDTHRIISILSEQFPTAIDLPAIRSRRPLINSIFDNIRNPKATAYYQIVHNGLREDSRAYVDRFHEWNGADIQGIPPFLLGADYVMCFNSDKWEKNLEITVDVAASVEFFVFFDDRLPVPKWLSDQFTRTKYTIGVDEGFPDGSTPLVTQLGPGNSIDNVYSVWRRDVIEPTQVRLGSLPKHIVEVSMYGIAAVPLETFLEAERNSAPPDEAQPPAAEKQTI